MKKRNKRASQIVTLVLISSTLSSCMKRTEEAPVTNNAQKIYMRADSTAPYTDVTENYAQQHNGGGNSMGSSLLWFMAFRSRG